MTVGGVGEPADPGAVAYATNPRYSCVGVRELNVSVTLPVVPAAAVMGAVTAILPALVFPNTHTESLKLGAAARGTRLWNEARA